ncbi:MAG: hypothetical protein P1Q69_07560 [Candidatus Thorarchaeota archaeon]|nr:hypothetical protein [Candidatus Thorarchaeota archaeon]
MLTPQSRSQYRFWEDKTLVSRFVQFTMNGLYTKVHSHCLSLDRNRVRELLFHSDRYKPPVGTSSYCDGEDMSRVVSLPLLLDTNLSNSWELDLPSLKLDGPVQSETVPNSFPFETRKANSLSLLSSTIEVPEGFLEVSQGFLWSTLGTLVHPWELGLLQTVEELVLFHGIGKSSFSLILFEEGDSLIETPVVDESCDSRMLVKG